MERKKIIKNLIVALICLSALALIGINIYQHQMIEKASQEMSQETSTDNAATSDITLDKRTHLSEEKNIL